MQRTATEKALFVLESLETTNGIRTLADIADFTGLPKPTVHRILSTLERRGYVRQLPSREYSLGPKVIALGVFAAGKDPLLSIANPVLDKLVMVAQETLQLGVLQGTEMLYVARREPEGAAVRLAAQPAPLAALHASAGGKVLLAFGGKNLLDSVVQAGLPALGPNTITDRVALEAHLQEVRLQNFAVSREERHEGVVAVAVPVRNRRGQVAATVTAAGPLQRMTDERIADLRSQLVVAAEDIGGGIP